MKYLDCRGCGLNALNVSQCTDLKYLNCGIFLIKSHVSFNYLTSLDVTNNIALEYLNCDVNELTSLDVSNNTALTSLYLMTMPALYKVCVWEMPFPPDGLEVYTAGSPNLYYTTDCHK